MNSKPIFVFFSLHSLLLFIFLSTVSVCPSNALNTVNSGLWDGFLCERCALPGRLLAFVCRGLQCCVTSCGETGKRFA
jgi:hypothetical protein